MGKLYKVLLESGITVKGKNLEKMGKYLVGSAFVPLKNEHDIPRYDQSKKGKK